MKDDIYAREERPRTRKKRLGQVFFRILLLLSFARFQIEDRTIGKWKNIDELDRRLLERIIIQKTLLNGGTLCQARRSLIHCRDNEAGPARLSCKWPSVPIRFAERALCIGAGFYAGWNATNSTVKRRRGGARREAGEI